MRWLTSLTFNNSIDVSAAKLYEAGTHTFLSLADLKTFAERNVMTTAEGCILLECSIQNLAYLVRRKNLKPIKSDERGSLYLKGELLRTKWE